MKSNRLIVLNPKVGGAGSQRIAELFRILCAFLIGIGIGFMYILSYSDISKPGHTYLTTAKKFAAELIVESETVTTKSDVRPNGTVAPQNSVTPPPLYLTASAIGRMGNLLFQYATAYGVARTVGKRLHVTEDNELLPIFPGIREYAYVTKTHEEIRDRHGVGDPRHCGFAPSVIQESRQAFNVGMGGYFQSFKYFHDYRNDLRAHLRFTDQVQKDADTQLLEVGKRVFTEINQDGKLTQLTWVAVHVRRGDIVTPHFANYGYLVATPEYLKKSADYFVQKYATNQRGVVFLVFSDDTGWCKSNFAISGDLKALHVHVEYIMNDKRELDMAMMARCNATIMSVGSFGWWAAYLSGGETFYYAYPFQVGSGLSSQFVMDDYYPPDWHLFF